MKGLLFFFSQYHVATVQCGGISGRQIVVDTAEPERWPRAKNKWQKHQLNFLLIRLPFDPKTLRVLQHSLFHRSLRREKRKSWVWISISLSFRKKKISVEKAEGCGERKWRFGNVGLIFLNTNRSTVKCTQRRFNFGYLSVWWGTLTVFRNVTN